MDRGCRSRSKVEKEAQYGKPQDPDDGGRNDDGDDYHIDDDRKYSCYEIKLQCERLGEKRRYKRIIPSVRLFSPRLDFRCKANG